MKCNNTFEFMWLRLLRESVSQVYIVYDLKNICSRHDFTLRIFNFGTWKPTLVKWARRVEFLLNCRSDFFKRKLKLTGVTYNSR